MREHWEKCHKIPLTEEFNSLVLSDSTKELAKKVKLPVLVAAAAAGTKKKRGRMGVNPAYGNPDYVNPEKAPEEVPTVPEDEHVVSTLTKKTLKLTELKINSYNP